MNTPNNQSIALLAVQDRVAGLYAWGLPLDQIANTIAQSINTWDREWTVGDIKTVLAMAGINSEELEKTL